MFRSGLSFMREPKAYFPFLLFLLLLLFILFVDRPFYLNMVFMILLFAGLSGAWNILGGFGGQLSLGHSAFFGLGAYTSSLLFVKCGIPPILGMFAGVGMAFVLAVVIGIPCFRLKGPFFSLATIAIAEVLQLLAVYFKRITEGSEGLSIPFQPSLYNLTFESRNRYALVAYCFAVLVLAISYAIQRSRLGYQLAALRDEDQAAESLGVNTVWTKMAALLISGGLTAMGATIFSQYILFLEPHSEFSIDTSVNLALISMIGGLGTAIGPLIGSFLLIPLQEFLRTWIGGKYQGLHLVIYGGLLIAVVMFMPQGIIVFVSRKYEALLSRLPSFPGRKAAPFAPAPPDIGPFFLQNRDLSQGEKETSKIIEVQNLSKHFGGLKAISHVSFSVQRGEILGIIGPNGAGKTTLFNMLSGVYKPDQGYVNFRGRKISGINKSHALCRAGIGRTYQLVKPFENMSVLENVMVGSFCHERGRKKSMEIALEVLNFVDLKNKKDMLAQEITLAGKKRLEVARVLATRPQLLLLDEVMAGLTPVEVQEATELILKIRDYGITVIVIEHVMPAIMSLSDRVLVLAQGEKITEGTSAEVVNDERVIRAYWEKVMSLLRLEDISVRYGDVFALREVSLGIEEKLITSLVGANGAGKSTVLRAISGLVQCSRGSIYFEDRKIERLSTDQRVEMGLIQIPEGRLVFPYMTAKENLETGSMCRRSRGERKENLEKVMEMFPILRERRQQLASTLSGGEQQMLAIARGLMARPRVLMLDEPSLGLSPLLVKEIFQILRKINDQGTTILLVEQNVRQSLEIAHYGYVLENGRIVLSAGAQKIIKDDHVRKAYLGLLK